MDLKPGANAHPYLFFLKADLPALRARARCSPHDVCYRLLLDTAAHLVRGPIPEEPAPPAAPADELRFQRRLYNAGCALQNGGQVLAFAYALSREPRYAARARDWALACASWPSWRQADADLPAAHYLLGASLIYDWLGDFPSAAERQILRRFLVDRLAAFHRRWQAGSEAAAATPFPAPDSAAWICLAAAGLGSLVLLREEERAPSWAADWARLFESWLLPASFGDQGEFLAGGDWRALHALRHGLLFLDALSNCSGPDLFLTPGLQAFPDFLLQSSDTLDLAGGIASPSWSLFPPPSPFHQRYVLLRLAAGRTLQPTLCEDLDVPRGVPLEGFYPDLHRIPCIPARWYTVSLSWDATSKNCRLGIDQQNWEFPLPGETSLQRVDGVCFSGPDFDLRHLGVRAGQAPAAVLLEQETELRIADQLTPPRAFPTLQTPELRMGFPAAPRGMVWFQLRKPGVEGQVTVRLLCDSVPGPGLRLAPVATASGPGAEFLRLDSDGQTAPPGGWCGGQIWFDAPWEYLWCDPEQASQPVSPRRSVHFAAAGLAFLRAAAGEPELRFCAGQAEGFPNSVALRVDGETLLGASPRTATASAPLSPDRRPIVATGVDAQEDRESNPWTAITSGRIAHFFSSPAFDAVAGEAGGVYLNLRGFRRRVVYIKPDYFVLADDFEIDGENSGRQLEWQLPVAGEPNLEDDRIQVQGRRGALEVLLLPAARPDEWEDAIRLSLEPTAGKAGLLALFVPLREGNRPAWRSEAIAVRGGHGLRLARGSAVDTVLFRDAEHDSLSAEGLRSDADLCFARRSGRNAPSLYALVQGTHLQARTELARTSALADLFVHQTPTRLSVSVQACAALELRLAIGGPPRAVRLDSVPLDADAFNYVVQGRRLVLQIPSGVHQLDVALK